jgi:hypothetical protein
MGKGMLRFYGDKLEFKFKDKVFEFKFEEIEEMAILGKKKMNFYTKDKTDQFFGDKRINMIKYLHAFYMIRNKKGGNEDGFMGI